MRRSTLLYLLPVLAAAPLAAQAFEGTVMMRMPVGGTALTDAKYMIKGDKIAAIMTMGPGAGPMAGKEMRMITDRTAMTMTMLIPIEMAGMKGMKQVIDLKKAAAAHTKTPVEAKALGTSDVVAGYKCDNFEITDGKRVSTLCITRELGTFIYPSGGMMGRGGGDAPAWVTAMRDHPGFPLRVSDHDGKVIMEVTGVKKGNVPSDTFEIPEGYSDMGGMMGGRGGGGH